MCEDIHYQGGWRGRGNMVICRVKSWKYEPACPEDASTTESDVILCTLHVVLQVTEGYFGLYHPELCQVAGCVRVFSPESWSKGVNVGQPASVVLALYLA